MFVSNVGDWLTQAQRVMRCCALELFLKLGLTLITLIKFCPTTETRVLKYFIFTDLLN